MKHFSSIGIIGLGVIGGSIGLAIQKRALADRVYGMARSESTLRKALSSGAIDQGTQEFSSPLTDAHLLILAAPVSTNLMYVRSLCDYNPHTFFTDVGSTKREILSEVDKVSGISHNFVGAHPMAGSEQTGFEYASADLFEGKTIFLSKTEKSSPESVERIADFWKALGGEIVWIEASRHDTLVAYTSHLPHLVAFALGRSLRHLADDPDFHKAIGKGFLDTTRISASAGEIWSDIFLLNRDNLLASLRIFKESLASFEDLVERCENRTLMELLDEAAQLRRSLKKNG